jgi:phosphoglycolate phosphatase/AHBA synthesis associated protein
MIEGVRAVLFDMDGVLVRTHGIWHGVVEEAGRRFRGRPVTREEFDPTFGQGTAADVEVFGLGCTVEELDRFYVDQFSRFVSGVWVDPSAAGVLEALAARGLATAVVTNTVSPLAEEILDAARLRASFQVIACADQVAHAKPAPDLVLAALDRLGVAREHAVFVGDSRYDREAAQAAGVRFVGLGIDGEQRVESLPSLLPLFGVPAPG